MRGKRILIIEDHDASCDTLSAMLSRRGAIVECARSMGEGEAACALARMEKRPFDVVVSDLRLGEMNPLETLAHLSRIKLPVRALTGLEDETVVAACAKAGVKLILKGTSAEGIMESIYYALMENHPDEVDSLASEVVTNRRVARELSRNLFGTLFVGWPIWAKRLSAFTLILTFLGTVVTGATVTLQAVGSRAIIAEQLRARNIIVDARQVQHDKDIAVNSEKIRSLEDDRLKMLAALKTIQTSIDKLDVKFDELQERVAPQNAAVWDQRSKGKTNADLKREGKLGLPSPTPEP